MFGNVNNGLEVEAVIVTREEREAKHQRFTAGNGWIVVVILFVMALYTLGLIGPR